jgi:hypothetical protein
MTDIEEHDGNPPLVFAFASENDHRFEWGHFLSSIGVAHVLLRDAADNWYTDDVPAISWRLRMKKTGDSVALGLSKGGYAALKFAKLADIPKVIAISPVTGNGFLVGQEFPEGIRDRVTIHPRFVIDDIKVMYADGNNPFVSCYITDGTGGQNEAPEVDRIMAERINPDRLVFVPGYSHGGPNNLARGMRDNGMLQQVLLEGGI